MLYICKPGRINHLISGFTWIRFWLAVKFYSSDPANLREEITR